jgi:integrase
VHPEGIDVAYLVQKDGRTFYLCWTVPPSLRKAVGKARFTATLGTTDRAVAERRAKIIEARWAAELAHAREPQTAQDDAAWYRKAPQDAPDDHQRALIADLIATEAQQRVDRAASRWGFMDEREDGYDRAMADDIAAATRFVDLATGKVVPLVEHLDAWIAQLTGIAKTSDVKRSTVMDFAKTCSTTADVTRKAVQGWVDAQQASGIASKTMRRKLSELRGYWSWMQRREVVGEADEPFTKIALQRPARKPGNGNGGVNGRRRAFTPEDMSKLLQAALEAHDEQLADLIELGRWTGCRLEEICSAKVEQVDLSAMTLSIDDAKTQAGIRVIPLHTRLRPLVQRLVSSSEDGFVLTGLGTNKYGMRSNGIGKRFGYLKTKLGYGPELVFHSLRKLVATQFEQAGVPESVAADILGHDKPTMSYGLYSGGSSMTQKRAAIEKLSY